MGAANQDDLTRPGRLVSVQEIGDAAVAIVPEDGCCKERRHGPSHWTVCGFASRRARYAS